MNLTALPAFSDNYIWMFDDGRNAVVVDPGDAAPVVEALKARRLVLAAILVTHHHADHVGGVDALRPLLRGPVHGPRRERIPEPFTPHDEGDRIEVLGRSFEVIDVPGHTAGHIAYFGAEPEPWHGDEGDRWHGDEGDPWHRDEGDLLLFCGDTLFSGGCGRLFEGTPADMAASLAKLAALPGKTRVCCAHEYTLSNLRFAAAVEPGNAALGDYTRWCRQQREEGRPTLPSSVARERDVNPFLRCDAPEVVASARHHGAADDDPVSVLATLREWKNEFR